MTLHSLPHSHLSGCTVSMPLFPWLSYSSKKVTHYLSFDHVYACYCLCFKHTPFSLPILLFIIFLATSIFLIICFLFNSTNNSSNSMCTVCFSWLMSVCSTRLEALRAWDMGQIFLNPLSPEPTAVLGNHRRSINVWITNEQKFHQFHLL